MFTNEQWRPVPGFEGYYSISNKGRFRSEPRMVSDHNSRIRSIPGKVLKIHILGLDKHNPQTRIRFCKYSKYTVCRIPELMMSIWGIHMTDDAVVLVNEDVLPYGIPVISDNPNCFFPNLTAASKHLGISTSAIRHSAMTEEPTRCRDGRRIKFRLLTDEEKEEYKEFLMNREAIV